MMTGGGRIDPYTHVRLGALGFRRGSHFGDRLVGLSRGLPLEPTFAASFGLFCFKNDKIFPCQSVTTQTFNSLVREFEARIS